MKRRTFDVLVPLLYVLAIVIAIFIRNEAGIGGVATIGAVCVAVYYAAVRQNLRV